MELEEQKYTRTQWQSSDEYDFEILKAVKSVEDQTLPSKSNNITVESVRNSDLGL